MKQIRWFCRFIFIFSLSRFQFIDVCAYQCRDTHVYLSGFSKPYDEDVEKRKHIEVEDI